MSDLEDDYNPRAHTSLLQAISGLKKTQHIRQSTRNEPKIKQDEFELVKGSSVVATEHEDGAPTPTAVAVNDLVQVLHKKKKHLDAGKLLRNVHRSKKVFQKPLEKPAAERIKRQIGYEKVKTKLERWDAVVSKNRAAETQVFPLDTETVYINTSLNAKPLQHTIKSDLRREMEAAEEKLRQLKRQREGDFTDETALEKRQRDLHNIKLTREELIARRKELAYLKMRESQQSAKARLRNKIKSKKYHKLLRRHKLQEQLKEFEQLQKTNPEAALEKLNELEKTRVRERATLRHKNTGAWAKNLQVRAKYDKDVRKDLAEQLQISRELTQKSKISDSEQSDEETRVVESPKIKAESEEKPDIIDDPLNPWITTARKSTATHKTSGQEQDENWRKYWMERNRNEKLLEAYKSDLNEAKKEQVNVDIEEDHNIRETRKVLKSVPTARKSSPKAKQHKKNPKNENGWLVEEVDPEQISAPLPDIDDIFEEVEDQIESRVQEKLNLLSEKANRLTESHKTEKQPRKEQDGLKNLKDLSFKEKVQHPTPKRTQTAKKSSQKAKQQKKNPIYENGWAVEEIDPEEISAPLPDIDDLFDEVEDQIEARVQEKLNQLSEIAKRLTGSYKPEKQQRKEHDELKHLKDLSFKEKVKHPTLDEELGEENESTKEKATISSKTTIDRQTKVVSAAAGSTTQSNIDPKNFPTVTFKQPQLNSLTKAIDADGVGDADIVELNGAFQEHHMTISEAFEDDDIVADFSQEKTKDSELKNTEIELTMPGWGSWAGAGIDESKVRKPNKRIVLKVAPEEKRRDENKDAIYINEEASKQLRPHLVSDLPFPFTSLQDYEASIRAPIGRNFVPETAFRMLTRPAVITRKGAIIEPMDKKELSKRPQRPHNVIDGRIEKRAKITEPVK